MGKKILQINVKCEDPKANFADAFLPAAQSIADVKGLLWKVWLMNKEEKQQVASTCSRTKHRSRHILKDRLLKL